MQCLISGSGWRYKKHRGPISALMLLSWCFRSSDKRRSLMGSRFIFSPFPENLICTCRDIKNKIIKLNSLFLYTYCFVLCKFLSGLFFVFHLTAGARVNSAGKTDFSSRISQNMQTSCCEMWSSGTGNAEGLCSRIAVKTQKSQLNNVEMWIFNLQTTKSQNNKH